LPDWDEMRVWQAYLRPSDLFVDVGASVGLYTILAAEIGCVVIAIEPVERSLRHLEANLALNGYRADVVEAALSNEEGICFVAGPDASRQHIVESESVPAGSTATRTVTLDSILAGRYAAGVKIDVEGAERRVLEGGKLALRDQRIGLIQLEWNAECTRNFGETREEVAHLLHVNGYELMRPDPSGVLRLAPDTASGQDMFARPRVES
jgi:FkbM family methyltransferase